MANYYIWKCYVTPLMITLYLHIAFSESHKVLIKLLNAVK